MFCVYKITNLINNKCYIGSSIDVERRWREHKNTAFNSNNKNYNYPLYKAFRKYGLENFSFKILKDDFNNLDEMAEYEYNSILFYNSISNGYNQTLATTRQKLSQINCNKYIESKKQKCAKVDIHNNILEIYGSYHEAARKNNFYDKYRATTIRQVCKGIISHYHNMYFRDLDENNNIIEIPFQNKDKKFLIRISLNNPEEEYYYKSILDAAKDLTNGDRREIQLHLKGSSKFSTIRGYLLRELDIYGNIIENKISIEDKIKEYNLKNPEINGIRHSISEWCKIYNISTACYYYRIKQGYNQIEAITMPKRR